MCICVSRSLFMYSCLIDGRKFKVAKKKKKKKKKQQKQQQQQYSYFR